MASRPRAKPWAFMKKELLSSEAMGSGDTSVKVLDCELSFARIGRIWPHVGDAHHPVNCTSTRSRAGPAKFLEGIKGYLQALAYCVYDAFFKSARGMTEVGCWMAGAAPDRTAVCSGGARQNTGAVGGAKVGTARTGMGAAARQAPPSAGDAAGGSAEESVRRRSALCAESAGGADTLSGRRRVGNCCEVPSLPAGVAASNPWFRGALSPIPVHSITRLTELFGDRRFPRSKLKQAAGTMTRWLSPVSIRRRHAANGPRNREALKKLEAAVLRKPQPHTTPEPRGRGLMG